MTEEPSSPATDAALTLIKVFGGKANQRVRRLMTTYLLGQTAYKLAKSQLAKRRENCVFTISVQETDEIYWDVHEWVLAQIPESQRKALLARTTTSAHTEILDDREIVDSGKSRRVSLFYDGSRSQTVALDGETVKVEVERGEHKGKEPWMRDPEKVIFTATSLRGRDAVLQFLNDIAHAQVKKRQRKPRLYVASPWGQWNRIKDVPSRPLDFVILQNDRKELFLADIQQFLADEPRYTRLGIPYHRGYLLYGPPGTGKTSISQAISSHLGLDVHYISLSAVRSDDRLIELFTGIDPRTVLIIEDIDIVHAVRERDDKGSEHVTLAGLLNALDGFVTPHGLITIMTTNDRTVLDVALTRPGRVDWEEEITYLDQDQLDRMLTVFAPFAPHITLSRTNLTPAEVVNVIKTEVDEKKITLRLSQLAR